MRIRFNRLDHVQVCVPPGAEDAARDFYGRVLGLPEIEKPAVLKPNGGLWFEVADIQLHVGVEPEQPPSKRHPAFEVEDLEAVRGHLAAHGVRIKPEPSIPGAHRLSFFDPFGNRIELLERTDS